MIPIAKRLMMWPSFLLVFLCCISSQTSYGQWVQIGPEGGGCSRLLESGGKFFACTSAGLYTSTDQGLNWEKQENGIEGRAVSDIVESEDYFFIISLRACYRSPKDELVWTLVFEEEAVYDFEQTQDYLFIGAGSQLFRSADHGDNWEIVNDNDGNPLIDIRLFSGKANTLAIYQENSNGQNEMFSMSYDAGESWTEILDIPFGVNDFRPITFIDDKVFVVQSQQVYLSEDNGTTWQEGVLPFSGGNQIVALDGVYYLLNNSGIAQSEDGLNWTSMAANALKQVRGLLKIGDDFLMASDYGLFYSDDGGASLAYRDKGIIGVEIQKIQEKDNYLFASGGTGIYRSDDNGLSWKQLLQPVQDYKRFNIRDFTFKGDTLFITNDAHNIRSPDFGETWQQISLPPPLPSGINAIAFRENRLHLAGLYGGVYFSDDGGETWTLSSLEENFPYVKFLQSENRIFIHTGNYDNHLFYSEDNGLNWITGSEEPKYLSAMAQKDDQLLAGTYTSNHLYQSFDDGDTWQVFDDPILNLEEYDRVVDIKIVDGDILVAVRGNGVFRLKENTNNWEKIFHETLEIAGRTLSLCHQDDQLFIGTNGLGIYTNDMSSPTQKPSTTSSTFQLYPNPTKDQVMIVFDQTPEPRTQVQITDLMGNLLLQKTIIETNTSMDLSNLANGIYVLRSLKNGKLLEKKKLVLSR